MHPRILFAFSSTRAHCWLMHHLFSTRSFSPELLFSRSAPNLHWCVTLHLPLNFIRFLSTHLCSFSRFSWMAAQSLVYQPHLWLLYHQACWGCTLSPYPGHWWTSRTGLNPILTPCQLRASKWTCVLIPTSHLHHPVCSQRSPLSFTSPTLPELQGCYRRQSQKPCWSQDRQHPLLSFHLSTQPAIPSQQIIRLVKHYFPSLNPCWLLLITFFYFTCLEMTMQDELFHHVSRDGGEADQTRVSNILFLALSEVTMAFLRQSCCSPWPFKDDGQWLSSNICLLLQHL